MSDAAKVETGKVNIGPERRKQIEAAIAEVAGKATLRYRLQQRYSFKTGKGGWGPYELWLLSDDRKVFVSLDSFKATVSSKAGTRKEIGKAEKHEARIAKREEKAKAEAKAEEKKAEPVKVKASVKKAAKKAAKVVAKAAEQVAQ